MKITDTTTPFHVIDYEGIQYGVCRDFNHVSRYRALRRVTHNPITASDRFVALETTNPFTTHASIHYYEVPPMYENRLDLIAYKLLGDATYGWVIAHFNNIEDGFTVRAGQTLMIPDAVTSLFNKGEILAPISPTMLNLGSE